MKKAGYLGVLLEYESCEEWSCFSSNVNTLNLFLIAAAQKSHLPPGNHHASNL